MSGGGLFHISQSTMKPHLVAILNYNDKNHFVATKIDIYIAVLRDVYNLKALPNPRLNITYRK